jgi:hypothetical protein
VAPASLVIAVDTNLLCMPTGAACPRIGARGAPSSGPAVTCAGGGIALASVAEFWSVVTHRTAPRPSTAREATALLAALGAGAAMQVWVPRVFDLQSVLTVIEHGASELWTHDQGSRACPVCDWSTRWPESERDGHIAAANVARTAGHPRTAGVEQEVDRNL